MKEGTLLGIKGMLYFLVFALLLPGELLVWGYALDAGLAGSYLAKRLQLSFYFDLPRGVFWGTAVLALVCISRAVVELSRRSHACDSLLFGGFPLYMFSLFLIFQLPCAMAFGIPLILLTVIALWFAHRPEDRPAFLLPETLNERAVFSQRVVAFFQLLPVLLGGSLIFQEGYLLWLSFRWTPVLIAAPLAGLLLPKPGQLREYVVSSVYVLILCGCIYGVGQFFAESVALTDFGIIMAYIFLELLMAMMIRPLLPQVRNISLLILGLSSLLTFWIMPPVCSPWFITMPVYVLYLLIDNRKALRKKLLSRAHFRHSNVHILSWEEYASQAWGFGALLAAYLAGPSLISQILFGLTVILIGGLIRSRILCDSSSDHLILRNFPYAIEITALLLSVIVSCSFSRDAIMILLSAFAAASCLMQMIWSVGGLIGKYTGERPSRLLFQIFSYGGMVFLLVFLFLIQAPAAVLLGCFCILSGIVRIGGEAYCRPDEKFGSSTGWVMIVIGQFFFVSSSGVQLPKPEWHSGAAVAALAGCAALYIYRLYDFRNRRKGFQENEKDQ